MYNTAGNEGSILHPNPSLPRYCQDVLQTAQAFGQVSVLMFSLYRALDHRSSPKGQEADVLRKLPHVEPVCENCCLCERSIVLHCVI